MQVGTINAIMAETNEPMSADDNTMLLISDFERADFCIDGIIRQLWQSLLYIVFKRKFHSPVAELFTSKSKFLENKEQGKRKERKEKKRRNKNDKKKKKLFFGSLVIISSRSLKVRYNEKI